MSRIPLCEILKAIRPLSREHKIYYLRGLIAIEKKRSLRRIELEAALKLIMNQQIRSEIRQDRREGKAA